MVQTYRLKYMEGLMTRLDKMLAGAEVTAIALPEELVTEINTLRQGVEANIANYITVKREDAVVRASVVEMKSTGLLFLRRVRDFLGADLSKADRRALRKQYGLPTVSPFGQERLLEIMANVIAVSAGQTDPTLKLPADMITSAQTQVQALQAALNAKRHYHAERIGFRQVRVELELQYRKVRNQVYAFLMQAMPEGSRDARLTDFGFRPSVLRRRQEAAAEVVVVEAVEVEEAMIAETVTSS